MEFWNFILKEIGILKIGIKFERNFEFWKLNLKEIKILKIIWELEFWKLNLRIGILKIKFKKLNFDIKIRRNNKNK